MKIQHLLIFGLLIISCNRTETNTEVTSIDEIIKPVEESGMKVTIIDEEEEVQESTLFKFDNEIIPEELIEFVRDNMDSLRIPTENDYQIEYFERTKESGQPFYCKGYFNNDTLIDHALVLIKDSLNHFVFAFHSNIESFEPFLLDKRRFSYESDPTKYYAIFDLCTTTDRTLEAIDTVYQINSDAISMSDIYESRTRTKVWDEKTKSYVRLFFD